MENNNLKFNTLNINKNILKAIAEMNYETMMEIQSAVIPLILDGNDIIGQAKTGTGKTAAFGIPIIEMSSDFHKGIEHLIITPTRELAIQIKTELEKLAKYTNVKIGLIIGGQDYRIERYMLKSNPNIIVGTPGRIVDELENRKLNFEFLKTITLDEADEMLSFGFKDELEKIIELVPKTRQSFLFSATIPSNVKKIADELLTNPKEVYISSGLETTESVEQYAIFTNEKNKFHVLIKLLLKINPQKAIIFGRTKRRAEELAAALSLNGFKVRALHGDLTQKERNNVMNNFRNNQFRILVATDVAARGLDIDGVDTIFNYDLPQEIEYYVHRIGRTGRALNSGKSYTLLQKCEYPHLELIMEKTKSNITFIKEPSDEEIDDATITRIANMLEDSMQDSNIYSQYKTAKYLINIYGAEHVVAALLNKTVPNFKIKDVVLSPEPPVTIKNKSKKTNNNQKVNNNKKNNSNASRRAKKAEKEKNDEKKPDKSGKNQKNDKLSTKSKSSASRSQKAKERAKKASNYININF